MKVPTHIFREYDVRGVVGPDLTPEVATALGRAVGTHVKRGSDEEYPTVVVGRDCRVSGPSLCEALISGIMRAGCHAVDIGMVPTPLEYWAIKHLGAQGGVQVTGSHNPPDYNGFKMTLLGQSLSGEAIQGLRSLIENDDFESHDGAESSSKDLLDGYIKDLVSRVKSPQQKLKVVVDAGNGMGGVAAVPLYEALGHEVIQLYCDPDGTFPNHHADPTVEENLEDLKAAVAKHSADVGLAFDGDADRLGVVDSDGSVVWGDRLMILLSRALLKQVPGATIIGEVKCSKTLYDDIRSQGGEPIMWRTGHSPIKTKMKESGAALAGEMSGHIFYAHNFYGFDDAMYAGARLLEILSEARDPIRTLLADVPQTYTTPEIRMPCPEEKKFDVVREVQRRFRDYPGVDNVIEIDGVRAEWKDGWGLCRASNTTPLLVLRFEALSEARRDEIRAEFEGVIGEVRKELGA